MLVTFILFYFCLKIARASSVAAAKLSWILISEPPPPRRGNGNLLVAPKQQQNEVPLLISGSICKDSKASLLVHLRDETLDLSGAPTRIYQEQWRVGEGEWGSYAASAAPSARLLDSNLALPCCLALPCLVRPTTSFWYASPFLPHNDVKYIDINYESRPLPRVSR